MTYRIDDGLDFRYISEMPKEQRPDTILRDDPTRVSDLGLVCTILGTDSTDKASEVLERINLRDYSGIRDCVPQKQADKILAALEFARRFKPAKPATRDPRHIFELVKHHAYSEQEHFIVVSLDGAYQLLDVRVVSIGLVNRTLVHPREVFSEALKKRATAVVLAHNHPSGNLEPSPDDLEVTSRLRNAGNLLGIEVLDHIIFSTEDYRSLAENGEFI